MGNWFPIEKKLTFSVNFGDIWYLEELSGIFQDALLVTASPLHMFMISGKEGLDSVGRIVYKFLFTKGAGLEDTPSLVGIF